MPVDDSLGNRMKAYERVTRTVLPPRTHTLIRVDGRAFHTYLRDSVKPFDPDFVADMDHVAALATPGRRRRCAAGGRSATPRTSRPTRWRP